MVTKTACATDNPRYLSMQTNIGCSDCGPQFHRGNTRRAIEGQVVIPRDGEAMSQKLRLTEDQRHQIVQMYRDGEKVSVIAQTFGVPTNYPGTLARRRGFFDRRMAVRRTVVEAPSNIPHPRVDVPVSEIRRLSAKGIGVTQIAALLRCPYRDVVAVSEEKL